MQIVRAAAQLNRRSNAWLTAHPAAAAILTFGIVLAIASFFDPTSSKYGTALALAIGTYLGFRLRAGRVGWPRRAQPLP